MKSIKLAHGVQRRDRDDVRDYKVIVIKNSVEFVPGQILDKDEVEELCVAKHWDVTIVPLREESVE